MTALPPDVVADLRQENARLQAELRAMLDRQAASAEILRTIASAPGEAGRSLQQIAETSARLFGAPSVSLQLVENGEWGQAFRFGNSAVQVRSAVPLATIRIGGPNLPGTVVAENRQIHIPDLDNIDPSMANWPGPPHARAAGTRTMCGTPLRREGEAIGVLIVYRDRLLPFTEEELALQQSFADQAVIAIENARLFNETKQALARETATSDILRVINNSAGNLAPVFNSILENAHDLCGAPCGSLQLYERDRVVPVAIRGMTAEFAGFLRAGYPITEGIREGLFANRPIQRVDMAEFIRSCPDEPSIRAAVELGRIGTMVTVPLANNGVTFGRIVAARQEVSSFSDEQIALLQRFADQAAIAIKNARLFNETREALERQTATADILKVIASSPSDVQPVFEAIATSSNRLIGGFSTAVLRFVGDVLHLAAFTPTNKNADEALKASFPRPLAEFPPFVLVRDGETMELADTESEDAPPLIRDLARLRGYRSMLFTPLMSSGTPIGMISVTRKEPGTFAAHHVQLVRTFADQAVIAIENVRLFDEVQAKTRDLSEALTYQTGSSNILSVIASSPTDVGPVLKAIVGSACELCEAYDAVVLLKDGDDLRFSAHHGPIGINVEKWPISRNWTAGRAFVDRKPVHVRDMLSNEGCEFSDSKELSRHTGTPGIRSILSVPLLRENESIGTILLRRTEVNPFSDKQIALLQTFADQAVIAIGNVRLFDEVQAKTRDLSEALQQQTATADVLKVISRSAFDLQTVLETLVRSAVELSGARRGVIFLRDGDLFRFQAISYAAEASPEWVQFLRENPQKAGRNSAIARSIASGEIVCVPDVLADPEINMPATSLAGIRAVLAVPLLRDGKVEGIMALSRPTPGPFNTRQIDLVQTFADQAVIAIENVRLFEEVQARTRDLAESLQQQTATADVLKVISRSAFDLDTVMNTLARSAAELCGTDLGGLFLRSGEFLILRGISDIDVKLADFLWQARIPIDDQSYMGLSVLNGTIANIPDFPSDTTSRVRAFQQALGFKALLIVPLMREGRGIGVFTVSRNQAGAFSQRQVELVQTFADQAVIAIENARLFDEVQARTRELSQSLDDLRTAQDRLVQTEKLASLGQLTAGIAHEIKNPLNFVNNFAALSAELTDELNDLLASAALTGKIREEVDELTRMLKDNLERVVQHGKRADSIVKNMLLHSREGSGEHRPADINALLDESLNLAYHGARAEKPQFNVTLQRDFDAMAGMIELFPQEITRVFLNLISNGFYAVTKRKTETDGSGFEPVLRAATRNLGDTVEIRIRDNGTGIPAEVREKMFNPFFTTKPAGEGTGLGLSMSHDIIVKQHGGRIEVETQPGEFTEFRIVLPRTSSASDKNRG